MVDQGGGRDRVGVRVVRIMWAPAGNHPAKTLTVAMVAGPSGPREWSSLFIGQALSWALRGVCRCRRSRSRCLDVTTVATAEHGTLLKAAIFMSTLVSSLLLTSPADGAVSTIVGTMGLVGRGPARRPTQCLAVGANSQASGLRYRSTPLPVRSRAVSTSRPSRVTIGPPRRGLLVVHPMPGRGAEPHTATVWPCRSTRRRGRSRMGRASRRFSGDPCSTRAWRARRPPSAWLWVTPESSSAKPDDRS